MLLLALPFQVKHIRHRSILIQTKSELEVMHYRVTFIKNKYKLCCELSVFASAKSIY